MTAATARVYYRNQGRTPDFVVVPANDALNADRETVKIVSQGPTEWTTVVDALAEIGYRPYANTDRIIRQADGTGSLTVEPVEPERPPIMATVSRDTNGILGTVRIGNATHALPPGITWPPADDIETLVEVRQRIDQAIQDLGYRRTGGLEPGGTTNTTGITFFEAPVEPDEWRDHRTLVRIDDTAAELLTRTAATLGLPADSLATAWIAAAAADALNRNARFLDAIQDHNRIRGWLPDGSAALINTATPPAATRNTGGSGW